MRLCWCRYPATNFRISSRSASAFLQAVFWCFHSSVMASRCLFAAIVASPRSRIDCARLGSVPMSPGHSATTASIASDIITRNSSRSVSASIRRDRPSATSRASPVRRVLRSASASSALALARSNAIAWSAHSGDRSDMITALAASRSDSAFSRAAFSRATRFSNVTRSSVNLRSYSSTSLSCRLIFPACSVIIASLVSLVWRHESCISRIVAVASASWVFSCLMSYSRDGSLDSAFSASISSSVIMLSGSKII